MFICVGIYSHPDTPTLRHTHTNTTHTTHHTPHTTQRYTISPVEKERLVSIEGEHCRLVGHQELEGLHKVVCEDEQVVEVLALRQQELLEHLLKWQERGEGS